jgi:hypothetical protein
LTKLGWGPKSISDETGMAVSIVYEYLPTDVNIKTRLTPVGPWTKRGLLHAV